MSSWLSGTHYVDQADPKFTEIGLLLGLKVCAATLYLRTQLLWTLTF